MVRVMSREAARTNAAWPVAARSRWMATALSAAVALGAVAMSGYVLGAAGSLVLASVWVLAAGIGRSFPGLHGPASWAAGVVAELALVLGMSAGVALVSPHLHGRTLHLAILAVPGLLGTVLFLAFARVPRVALPQSRWGIALTISTAVLSVATWVASRAPFAGIAWAMSGDARNHLMIMRGLLWDGGLTVRALEAYPAAVNAFAAAIAGAGDRGGPSGQTLSNDIHAIATTYVLAAMAIAALLAAALLELVPHARTHQRRLPEPIVVTILVASAAAGSPFMLGMAVGDGFFSAYGSLAVVLAGVVLSLRFSRAPGSGLPALVLAVGSMLIAFFSWTVVVVVPAALVLSMSIVAMVRAIKSGRRGLLGRGFRATTLWLLSMAFALSSLAAVAAVVVSVFPRLTASFVLLGSSRGTSKVLLGVVGLVALGTVLATRDADVRRQMLMPAIAAAAGGLTVVWLVRLPGEGMIWTYYALKTNWLATGSLLWVLFAPIVLWFSREPAAHPGTVRTRAGRALAAGSWSVAILVLVGSATNALEPFAAAESGWDAPSARVVQQAIAAADDGRPFVFWNWSDTRNDRIGNFWAATAWASDPTGRFTPMPQSGGDFAGWAYGAVGDASVLCTLVVGARGIDVYTRDNTLDDELRLACPTAQPNLVMSLG